jgi:hypothetical protein
MQCGSGRNSLICKPLLEEVLLKDISMFCEPFLCTIGEYYSDSMDTLADYRIREAQIQVRNGDI